MPRQRFGKLPAEKREKILEAAGREFAEQGYDGASMNRLLRAAGVSKGAAYYYFDDKADLFLAVLEHHWDRIARSAILDFDAHDAEGFWGALGAVYRALLDMCVERPWLLGLARSVWSLSPEMRSDDRLGRVLEGVREWFASVLGKGRAVGAIRTDLPDDLIISLLMAVDSANGTWLLEHWVGFEDPEREALDFRLRTLDMVRRMFAPGAAAP